MIADATQRFRRCGGQRRIGRCQQRFDRLHRCPVPPPSERVHNPDLHRTGGPPQRVPQRRHGPLARNPLQRITRHLGRLRLSQHRGERWNRRIAADSRQVAAERVLGGQSPRRGQPCDQESFRAPHRCHPHCAARSDSSSRTAAGILPEIVDRHLTDQRSPGRRRTERRRQTAKAKPDAPHIVHGLRGVRASRRAAAGSPTISCRTGSHRMVRPVRRAMLPR